MKTCSVIIIARNEAENIRACLESVRFAHEIIVFDSGSTDGTPAICREYTDRVFVTDWPGFGVQKNRALQQATCDWVLSLDADEAVTPELAQEIQAVIQDPKDAVAFAIPMQTRYCGKVIRYGDWHKTAPVRLFKRGAGRFTDSQVHERLVIDGKIKRLKQTLTHDSFRDLEEVLEKVNRYSSLGARMKHERGKTGSLTQAILHGLWTFIRGYILRGGFLDGKHGFMLAISNAEGCYYRYLKLSFMNAQKPPR